MNGVICCWRCGQSFNVFPTMHGRRIICGRCEAPIDIGHSGDVHAPSLAPAPSPAPTPFAAQQFDPFYAAGSIGHSVGAPNYSAGPASSSAFDRVAPNLNPDTHRSRLLIGICAAVVAVTVCGLVGAIVASRAIASFGRGKAVASTEATTDGPASSPVAPSGNPLVSGPVGGPTSGPFSGNPISGHDVSGDNRFASNPANTNENSGENPFESRAGNGDDHDHSSDADVSSGAADSNGDSAADSNVDDEEFVFGGAAASDDNTAAVAAERANRRKFAGFSLQPPAGWRNTLPDNEVVVAGFSFDEDARGNMRGAILVFVLPMKLQDTLSFVKVYTSDGEQKIIPSPIHVDGAVAYRLVGIQGGRIVYSIAFVRNGRAYIVEGCADKDVGIMKEVQRLCDSWRWDDGASR